MVSEPIEEFSKRSVCQSTQNFCVAARGSAAPPGKGCEDAAALSGRNKRAPGALVELGRNHKNCFGPDVHGRSQQKVSGTPIQGFPSDTFKVVLNSFDLGATDYTIEPS